MDASRLLLLAPLLALACSKTVVDSHGGFAQDQRRWSFDAEPREALPAGWEAAETNGRGAPGRWEVAGDGAAGTRQCVRLAETQNRGSTFNLLLAPDSFPADLAMTVSLRAEAGEEDQGGGLVWRLQSPDDYYITRWNPLEDNLRLYKVEGSVRTMLASAEFHADPDAWHRLEVVARGSEMEVRFDGRSYLHVQDGTFSGPGRIGLWTKADAATAFDELTVEPR